MNETLARNWQLVTLRGILSILFGLSVIMWQHLSLYGLVAVFGIYSLLEGVIAIVISLAHTGNTSGSRVILLESLINVIAGLVALMWPFTSPLAIILLIGTWAILTGIVQVVAALFLRREIRQERLLAFGGLVSVVLGILLFGWPDAGMTAIAWTISVNIQLFGMLMIALGLLLRKWQALRSRQTRPV